MMMRTVNRNLLKWAAGQYMFCPYCDACMDCKRTVYVEVQFKNKDADWTVPNTPKAKVTSCASCWDKQHGAYKDAVSNLLKKEVDAGTGKLWRLDIIDGREVFGRRKK